MSNLRIQTPDGTEIDRQVVRHPGAVAVVPLLADGETVILVRQYRAALDAQVLELPAGKLDVENEDLTVAAQRELVEEIGRRAGRFELLAEFLNSPGFTDERCWVFLARDLTETAGQPPGSRGRGDDRSSTCGSTTSTSLMASGRAPSTRSR